MDLLFLSFAKKKSLHLLYNLTAVGHPAVFVLIQVGRRLDGLCKYIFVLALFIKLLHAFNVDPSSRMMELFMCHL
jgi:hypothetical protein